MFGAPMFDTLKFSKRLINTGMPKEQAEELACAQLEMFEESLCRGLASKTDIENLDKKIDENIHALEKRMDDKINTLENKLSFFEGKFNTMQWMLGFIITFLIAILVKLFI